jgi:uncharacterized membrane protein
MPMYQVILLALCATLYSVNAGAQPYYTINEVDIHVEGVGQSLGEDGGIVGSVRTGDGSNQPALWQDGHITMLPGVEGIALARDFSGVSVGVAYFPTPPFARPMEWRPDGQVFFWSVPPGMRFGQINAINGNGVAACTYSDGNTMSAARCTRAGFEVLPTLGGSRAEATGIIGAGTVVGSAENSVGHRRIVAWQPNGQVLDYGNLRGSQADLFGVTFTGDVAGAYVTEAGQERAFGGNISSAGLVALARPQGFDSSAALGVNSRGVRVGYATRTISDQVIERAMLWSSSSATPIDLNALIDPTSGWELRQAISINDAGEILARAFHSSLGVGVVLLEPTLGPALALELNQTSFSPGETLRMTLHMRNDGPLVRTDVYIGVIPPDGVTSFWSTSRGFVGPVPINGNPAAFTPYVRDVVWGEGSLVTWRDFWVVRLSGAEAPGVYHIIAAWTRPDGLLDGRIDQGDVLALDWQAIHIGQ